MGIQWRFASCLGCLAIGVSCICNRVCHSVMILRRKYCHKKRTLKSPVFRWRYFCASQKPPCLISFAVTLLKSFSFDIYYLTFAYKNDLSKLADDPIAFCPLTCIIMFTYFLIIVCAKGLFMSFLVYFSSNVSLSFFVYHIECHTFKK